MLRSKTLNVYSMLLGLIIVVGYYYLEGSKTRAYIKFNDVGNGDSIHIGESPCPSVVVDGGPDYMFGGLGFMCNPNKCHINALILTHPHADHLVGLIRLLDLCTVDTIFYNESLCDSADCLVFNQKAKNFEVSSLHSGDSFRVGQFTFYVLWPGEVSNDLNDSSIVLLVDYGGFEALLTGDISAKVQKYLDLDKYAHIIDEGIDLYKVPHHGAISSFSEEFLDLIQPKLAIISVGKNSYGHPSDLFLKYFKARHIRVFRTDKQKTVKIYLEKTP